MQDTEMEDFDLAKDVIKNTQEIHHTKEMFTSMVQRLEEKVDDLKSDVQAGFASVNARLDLYEKGLSDKIDERIEANSKSRLFNLVKWIVVTVGGSVTISVIAHAIISHMK